MTRMTNEEKLHVNLKIDHCMFHILQNYHNITPLEAVNYFSELADQMSEGPGNIANDETRAVRTTKRDKNTGRRVGGWRTEKTIKSTFNGDTSHNAYCLRGFYPGTKLPFKMTGVKLTDKNNRGHVCYVIKIGDKDQVSNFNRDRLRKIKEATAEGILLDKKPEEINDKLFKIKPYKCMRPNHMPLLNRDD